MPALHTCIPYVHLGNSWRTSFHSAGLSHPSTILIEKIAFLWTSISKVLWNSNFSVFLRAPPSTIPVGQQKEGALIGRLGALLRPTWQSYAGLPPEEGACVTGLPFRLELSSWAKRRISVHADSDALAFTCRSAGRGQPIFKFSVLHGAWRFF